MALPVVAAQPAGRHPAGQNPGGASAPTGGTVLAGYPGPGTPAGATASAVNPSASQVVSGTRTAGTPLTGSTAGLTTTPGAPTALTPMLAVAITATLPPPSRTPVPVTPGIILTTGVPRFEAGPCMFTLPLSAIDANNIKCGYLIVHEEHADPSSPTIRLAVAILPSTGPNPKSDPIVFNQGGPGFGSIDTYVALLVNSPFREKRSLVIFDQRGTGYSKPALACPEVIDETIATLNQNLKAAEANKQYNDAALKCRDRLVQSGVNLSAYNTQENAGDIDDLRQALGYSQLNLYGVSYGSLLVLDALRFYPQAVRSAIIDGVLPPQVNVNTNAPFTEDRAFTQLFQACVASAPCNAAYPKLETTFFNLVANLNQKPASLHLVDPTTGESYPALLTGDFLIQIVFQTMYETDLIPLLPEIIRRATHGDYAALEPIAAVISLDRNFMTAMYWSVICAEDADFNPGSISYNNIRPQLAKDQDLNIQSVQSLCRAWGVRDLAPLLNQPVTGTVPALVLNGRFDPITPPSNGVLAAQGLANSTVITFATTGHGAFPAAGQCLISIMSAFVDNPALAVDTRCVNAQPALAFVTPGKLVNFSVVNLSNGLLARRPGLIIEPLVALLADLVLLSGVVLFPLSWLLKRGKKPPGAALANPAAMAGGAPAAAPLTADPAGLLVNFAPWIALLTGLLPIAFAAVFIYFVGPLVLSGSGILLLGLPASLTWLFLIPLVNVVLALLLVVATLLGLTKPDWSGRRKAYFIVLSLAGLTLVVMLGLLGLLTALLGLALSLSGGLIGTA
jgi:pimeloyl-ACP methyl ester carboxylesterase